MWQRTRDLIASPFQDFRLEATFHPPALNARPLLCLKFYNNTELFLRLVKTICDFLNFMTFRQSFDISGGNIY